jgi:predicted nucleic acid-binding protein
VRRYIDACVLILALKATEEEIALRAIAEISDENVEYVFSPVIELEVLPHAQKHNTKQAEFYQAWFEQASRIAYDDVVHQEAMRQKRECNIAPLDCIHVASAITSGADELVTAEGPTKPMFSTKDIKVRSIR